MKGEDHIAEHYVSNDAKLLHRGASHETRSSQGTDRHPQGGLQSAEGQQKTQQRARQRQRRREKKMESSAWSQSLCWCCYVALPHYWTHKPAGQGEIRETVASGGGEVRNREKKR
jgi:hypothetical protein